MSKIKLYYKIINAVINTADCDAVHNYNGEFVINHSMVNSSTFPMDFMLVKNGKIMLYVIETSIGKTIGISNQLLKTIETYMESTDLLVPFTFYHIKTPLARKLNNTYDLKINSHTCFINSFGEGYIITK